MRIFHEVIGWFSSTLICSTERGGQTNYRALQTHVQLIFLLLMPQIYSQCLLHRSSPGAGEGIRNYLSYM